MKRNITILLCFITLSSFSILLNSCRKDNDIPVLTTISAKPLADTIASSGGILGSYNSSSGIFISGVCWNSTGHPTLNDNKTIDVLVSDKFSSSLTGLIPNTQYYVRAFIISQIDTTYGNEVTFRTLLQGQVADIDGNIYNTIKLGTQIWMVENLKSTKLYDGAALELVSDSIELFAEPMSPRYCWYNNDKGKNKDVYGALYNWEAVKTGKLCPVGWHVPSVHDWIILANTFGGSIYAGGSIKEAGTAHWVNPNIGATNIAGFTALPGGYLYDGFKEKGITCYFWTNEPSPVWDFMAWSYQILNEEELLLLRSFPKYSAISVRCVRDN